MGRPIPKRSKNRSVESGEGIRCDERASVGASGAVVDGCATGKAKMPVRVSKFERSA